VSDKFVMDPRVAFVTQILEEIEHGIIKIPRFQRELVWKWEQQRDLLCSIVEGIPIGSILVWSTNLKNITAYDSIGPFSLKYDDNNEKIPQQMYLMDGLQRMSTLYTIVKHPEYSAMTSDLAKYEVFADLLSNSINNMFLRKQEILSEGGDPSSYQYLPLRYIFDQKQFMRFLRQIPTDEEALIDRADDIVIAFKSYKVPMIPMRSDKQELVTKSFERINTRGTVMSEAHMLNALSYSPEFELLTSLNKFKKQFLNEFHSDAIYQSFILQLIKLHLGISIYDKNTDSIAKKVNDELLRNIFNGLRSLLHFAKDNYGEASIKAFPYRLQALGVCHALIVEPDFQAEHLKSWVTVTAYAGAFGTTARNSELALEDWIRYISTRELKWSLKTKPTITLWKDNVSFRNTRFKLWALALAQKQDEIVGTKLSERFFELKGKLINKPIEIKDKSKRSANYFLTSKKNFSLQALSECQSEAYFLNDDMLKELKDENYEEFRELRETAIFNYEVTNIFTPAAETLGLTNYKIER
tara:strand:+ start:2615 stop:4192 length:1578 start_codon:yes stop_codon:yes gene_type:complete